MFQKTKNIYHLLNAVLANFHHGFPSRNLIVVGVTGTDGKTTTTNLIGHILTSAGLSTATITTIGASIDGKVEDTGFHVTTPSSWKLQEFIKRIAKKRATKQYLVLEVTSHALDQFRAWGIKFEVGVLTNITNEHLDYHRTYENYVKTKSTLLIGAKHAVINKEDESFDLISKNKKIMAKSLTYGFEEDADLNKDNFPFETSLVGEFNKYNILAAAGVCRLLGLSDPQIQKGIKTFKAPMGRQEIVHDGAFAVMIDFAHTSNAFLQLLPDLKKSTKGKIIHVFGAAGKRDVGKRSKMGEASAKYANIMVLTAEDPRGESLENIFSDIEKGIKNKIKGKDLFEIIDRKEAIKKAISMAGKGDLVLLSGKSHEKSMNLGHGEEPWDEYQAVEEALQ